MTSFFFWGLRGWGLLSDPDSKWWQRNLSSSLVKAAKKWRTNAQKGFCFVIFYFCVCVCATSASIYQIEREREKLFGNQIDRCISVCTVTLERTWGRLSTGVRFSLKEKKKSLLEFFVFKFLYYFFFIVVLLFPFGHFCCWAAAERAKRVDLSCTTLGNVCVYDTKIFVDCFLAAVWWLLAPIKENGGLSFLPPVACRRKEKNLFGDFSVFSFSFPPTHFDSREGQQEQEQATHRSQVAR